MFGETFEIKVGNDPDTAEKFTVHKKVASFYSGYFTVALKDTFKEGKEGIIELPNEDIDTVRAFVAWLYTRQLPTYNAKDFKADFKLWVFANSRDVPLLENIMIDRIIQKLVEADDASLGFAEGSLWRTSFGAQAPNPGILDTIALEDMEYVWANTHSASGLRQLLIAFFRQAFYRVSEVEELQEKCTEEMGNEIFLSMLGKQLDRQLEAASVFRNINACDFHTHPQGVRCHQITQHVQQTVELTDEA